VLDPDPAEAFKVDAGLDGDDMARRERVGRHGRNPWRLVDVEPDAVARGVHERVAPARLGDDVAAHLVDLGTFGARLHRGDAATLMRHSSPASLTRRSCSMTPSVGTSSASANHSLAKVRWRAQVTSVASSPMRPMPAAAPTSAAFWPARLPISMRASTPAALSCSADWNA